MATTDVELCNVALGLIGHKKPISSLTASTVESQQCAIFYPHAKGLVSAAHPWAFASRMATLAAHATATDPRFDFVYAAPTDMAAPRSIWNGSTRNPNAEDDIPFLLFDVGTDANPDAVILTDQEDAQLIYTTKSLPIAVYPVPVQHAVAYQLAAFLAGVLAVNPRLGLGIEQKAAKVLAWAAALEFNKEHRDQPQDPATVQVR